MFRCRGVVRAAGMMPGVLSLLLLGSAAAPALGGLQIVSQSVDVNWLERQAIFSLAFDHPPQFDVRDSLGRPLESFQYEIVPDATDINHEPFTAIRAVIRGDEIDRTMTIPIRDGIESATDPAPQAGGWGYVRGQVPLSLDGSRASFAAPLWMLDAPDGRFAYRVFATTSGETTSLMTGAFVPLPPMFWIAAAMLGVMTPIVLRRSRRGPSSATHGPFIAYSPRRGRRLAAARR